MSINITWYNVSNGIIRMDLHGHWAWEEYHTSIQEISKMALSVPHRVDIIQVRHRDAMMPPGNPLHHLLRAQECLPRNVGMTVSIGSNHMTKAVQGIITSVYSDLAEKLQSADNIDAALSMIQRSRQDTVSV